MIFRNILLNYIFYLTSKPPFCFARERILEKLSILNEKECPIAKRKLIFKTWMADNNWAWTQVSKYRNWSVILISGNTIIICLAVDLCFTSYTLRSSLLYWVQSSLGTPHFLPCVVYLAKFCSTHRYHILKLCLVASLILVKCHTLSLINKDYMVPNFWRFDYIWQNANEKGLILIDLYIHSF